MISNELISQLTKVLNAAGKDGKKSENTVYGTVVVKDGSPYVKLDGSQILTPVSSTVSISDGDRVTVLVKDHSMIINGNITSPSIDKMYIKDLFAQSIEATGSISGMDIKANKFSANTSYWIYNGESLQRILYYDKANNCILLGKMGDGTSVMNGAGFEFHDDTVVVYGDLNFYSGNIDTPGHINANSGFSTNGNVNAGGSVSAGGNISTGYNFLADNDRGLYVKDTGGSYRNVATVNTSDQVLIGAGLAWAKKGQLCLMGNSVTMYDGARNVWWTPYYVPGTTFTIRWRGSGFITSSGSWVCFFIPFDRPLVGVSACSVRSNPGLKIRQNGKYLYGSSANADVYASSYSATITQGGIHVTATMGNTTNASNNAPCGIDVGLNVTFS